MLLVICIPSSFLKEKKMLGLFEFSWVDFDPLIILTVYNGSSIGRMISISVTSGVMCVMLFSQYLVIYSTSPSVSQMKEVIVCC